VEMVRRIKILLRIISERMFEIFDVAKDEELNVRRYRIGVEDTNSQDFKMATFAMVLVLSK
jgi:hypothetical protein